MPKQRVTTQLSKGLIENAAIDHGIPAGLALAVWEQESGSGTNRDALQPRIANPEKPNYGNVRGEFQVIDSTFRKYFPKGDPDNPQQNMLAGIKELASAYSKSNGDIASALAVYHSGSPSIVDKNGMLKQDRLGRRTGTYVRDVIDKYQKLLKENPAWGEINPVPLKGPARIGPISELQPDNSGDLFSTGENGGAEPPMQTTGLPPMLPPPGINPQTSAPTSDTTSITEAPDMTIQGGSAMIEPSMYGMPVGYWNELKRQSQDADEQLTQSLRDMLKEVEDEDAVRLA